MKEQKNLKGLFLFIEMSDESGIYIAEWFPLCEPNNVIIPNTGANQKLRVSRVAVLTEQDISKRLDYIKGKTDFNRFEFRMQKEANTCHDAETIEPEKRNCVSG